MKAVIACASLITLFALGGSGTALAGDDCGMNSNKPCPGQEKLSSKEPAYSSMNSNQPTAQRTDTPTARTEVQAKESGESPARATLTGVSASDLKVKPKPPKGSEKEPANPVP